MFVTIKNMNTGKVMTVTKEKFLEIKNLLSDCSVYEEHIEKKQVTLPIIISNLKKRG